MTDGPAAGVLVVGYGNPLRSDDGVGPAVAEALAADPRLAGAEIRAEHQLTPELALDASRASLLVLIDAAEDLAPGAIEVRRLDTAVADRAFTQESGPPLTHHMDPSGILGLSRELFGAAPATVVIIGIGAAVLEVGETLSPLVAATVPRVVEIVAGLVLDHGAGLAPAGAAEG